MSQQLTIAFNATPSCLNLALFVKKVSMLIHWVSAVNVVLTVKSVKAKFHVSNASKDILWQKMLNQVDVLLVSLHA